MATFTICVAAAIIVVIAAWFSKRSPAKSSLAGLPVVKFDENDTRERYTSDTRSLMKHGYQKVHSQCPFQGYAPLTLA